MLKRCERPPEGWECSREPGHEGPCAARQIIAECPAWVKELSGDPRIHDLGTEAATLRLQLADLAQKAEAAIEAERRYFKWEISAVNHHEVKKAFQNAVREYTDG
jgi:hypothetical protein